MLFGIRRKILGEYLTTILVLHWRMVVHAFFR